MRRALAIVLLLAFAAPVQAQEEPTGEVRGRVLVGGADGPGAVGLEVILTHLTLDPMPPRSTTTDNEGEFLFEDLPMGPRHGYIASVAYQGLLYESEFLRALSGETVLAAELVVYPRTASVESLSIARIHDVVTFEPGALLVLEFIVVENSGELAIAPEGGIRFPLPEGAQDLAFPEEDLSDTLVLRDGELWFTAPLLPGTSELVYVFRIPLSGASYQWEVPVAYPTGAVDLLVQDAGVDVEAAGLTFQGVVEPTTDETYLLWSGAGVDAGGLISVSFLGMPSFVEPVAPAQPSQKEDDDAQRWLQPLAALLAPAGAAAAALYAKYRTRYLPATGGGGTPPETRRRRRQLLLQEIARLDDEYAAGRVPERRYQHERRAAKDELARLFGSEEAAKAERQEGPPGD